MIVCIYLFALFYFALLLIDRSVYELIEISSDLIPDILFMNADSDSDGPGNVPDLTSDTSDMSDGDHEQEDQHQLLQDLLDRRAEVHQRELEQQARLEELTRELDEQTRELEVRIRQLHEQRHNANLQDTAREADKVEEANGEYANALDRQGREAAQLARVIEEDVNKLRESISRNTEQVREIQERYTGV